MDSKHPRHVDWRRKARFFLIFLFWATIFTLVYAQSPLFTSNQNQYFLHGLAQGGFGYLDRDWLANTIDPTPVFSRMVQISYTLFHWPPIYYIFYGIILGVFLFSLASIVYRIFDLELEKGSLTVYTAIILVNSAAIRYLFSRLIKPEWSFLLEGGLANQRVLGQVFQPSVLGVFLILSIYLFLIDKPIYSVLVAAIAVYFHPTYLLSYVILILAYLIVTWMEKKNLRNSIVTGMIALLVVLPVVVQVYSVFNVGSSQMIQRAREILVDYRIPHHADISDWFDFSSIIQIGLICCGIFLVKRTRLFGVLLFSAVSALFISLLQILTKNDALALLLPWRISVIIIPISVAVILGASISELLRRFPDFWKQHSRLIRIVNISVMTCLAMIGILRFSIEYQEQTQNSESGLYTFVRASKMPEDIYLVPIKDQDFRLETGAPVYVDFKSIPYSSEDVLEWFKRVKNADVIYEEKGFSCSELSKIANNQNITQAVFQRSDTNEICPDWTLSYQDETYQVWRYDK